jgi:Tfp pilus assembly protein PilF
MTTFVKLIALFVLVLSPTCSSASSESAAEYTSAGAKLLAQGHLDSAISEFQRAVNSDPTYFPARLHLASAFERAGKTDEAIAAYRDALNLRPDDFLARNNLGVLLDKKGEYEEAIGQFEQALRSQPGNPMALKNLDIAKKNEAVIAEREARIAQAEKEARARLTDPRAAYNLARIYAFYGEKEAALEWLRKAVNIGYKDFAYLNADPAFTAMREDPVFAQFANRK